MQQTAQLEHSVLDAEILKLGEDVWQGMQGEQPGLFNAHYWHGRLLEWVMKDPTFKVDLFRFVDVLPALHTTEQVAQHVREYLLKDGRELPGMLTAALKAATHGLTAGLAARTIKKNVADMAEQFIAGNDVSHALPVLRTLHRHGIAFTVDVLGEATLSDAEAATYQARYLALIDQLADACMQWPADPIIDHNHLGAIPRVNVSIKVSALDAQLDAVDPIGSVARLKQRLLPLLLRAKERHVFVNLDLEQWALHGITYDLFEDLVCHPELRSWPHLGIVVQAYLTQAQRDVERLRHLARARGTSLTVRLVKGAYWDYEVVHARQHGYPCPVFTEKAATDANYEHLTAMLLEHVDDLQAAFGSHNLRSLAHAIVLAQELGVPTSAYELQMLHGMAEPERRVLRAMGHRVRVYAPIGELLPGMAYLVRRLLENTANSGFLRLSFHEGTDLRSLLRRPQPLPFSAMRSRTAPEPFSNCPLADFSDAATREAFVQAIDRVAMRLPIEVPVCINEQVRTTDSPLERCCPSEIRRSVARISLATCADVDGAVASALQAWPAWRDRALDERAGLLERLADRLQRDRFDLAALQTFEVGKPWREADADVAEAIDFCRYYAQRARLELAPQRHGTMAGEENLLWYEGRGPTAVIAPWNFPLAILCGMSTAALVAGNPVLLKPAEQASATAYALYVRMREVGFPPDVVHFVPGMGEDIGSHLVRHPQVAQIAFTGSKQVGLSIIEAAAVTRPGQTQVKRVVCEMGGKNATIIDDDADLDEAVVGVVHSAFGYAGQKCSACSRVLVVRAVYASFMTRLIDAVRSLSMAPAHLPGCRLGPVIDAEAYQRLTEVIAHPGAGAKAVYIGQAPPGGWFVAPAIFAVHDTQHRLMQEEFFGPILAVMPVDSFEQTLEVAVSTQFALTGSVYSRSTAHLDLARQRFRVGNLYLNRGSTGAMVARQPFGGFGMSGLGTKAGGPGYVTLFADARCATENTMRRGFTPELQW